MFKKAFSIFFLTYTFLAPAMAVQEFKPGTVVDPINQAGQYTISVPDAINSQASGMPAIADAGASLFSTKGIPVVISTVAGNAPWWALTTGTGYLIISQFDPTASYASAITAGLGYAAGQEIGTATQGYMASTLGKASQLALLATLLGGSMVINNPLYSEAFMAAAQALGLQTAFLMISQIAPQSSSEKSCAPNSDIMNNIKVALNSGLADVLHVHAVSAFVSMLGMCDKVTLIRILLYEQAYRLAQSGSAVAKKLFTPSTETKAENEQSQPHKKERPIVTLM